MSILALERDIPPLDQASFDMDLAWSAGFVDGEGCLSIARQKQSSNNNICYRLKFSVVQNNLEVLEEVQTILDESSAIYKLKRTDSANRQSYTLTYDGRHALNAIKKLRPYLRRKRYEADAVFKMYEETKIGQRPGPKGWPPEIYEAREKWTKKLSRLK